MPTAAYHECRYPLCRAYVVRAGYCELHAPLAAARPGSEKGLTPANKRFRRMRHAFLVRHPLCATCKHEAATILDHVVPHRGVAALYWDQDNWQGQCVHCHGVKTAREVWGQGPRKFHDAAF